MLRNFIWNVLLVLKWGESLGQSIKAYRLPTFQGVFCGFCFLFFLREERGDPSNLKKTYSVGVFCFWHLNIHVKCRVRVQKRQMFSKDICEQPQKSFMLLGTIQFWWWPAGCSRKYQAGYRVACILPCKFWRKATTLVCSTKANLLQPLLPLIYFICFPVR